MSSVPVKQSLSRSVDRRVRSRRDFAAMEERRMRAADLFEQGVIPAEIARQVGGPHQIVSDWRAARRRKGRDGLRAASRAGRLPKLSREQLALVELERWKVMVDEALLGGSITAPIDVTSVHTRDFIAKINEFDSKKVIDQANSYKP